MDGHRSVIRETSETFDALPFSAADGKTVNELRELLVKRAHNDWALMTLAAIILKYERTNWAVQWIREQLAQPGSPGDIARAVMLAGLLDDSTEVKCLWEHELAAPPLNGWIAVAWQALEWLDRALAAQTDEHFFALWRLFFFTVDRRMLPVVARCLEGKINTLNARRRDFVELNWDYLVDKAKKEKDKLGRTLYSFRTGFRWAYPWAAA